MDSLLSIEDISMALSLDYECVFFVDIESDNYAMFAFGGNHKNLELSETSNFWADSRVNLETVVYEDDKAWFAENIATKENLVASVQNGNTFRGKYRIFANGTPVWYSMKVVRGQGKQRDYLIIGVTNIDKQERESLALKQKASKSELYGQIVMALAERYDALYMVDLETNHYVQYKSERVFCELSIALEGDDFFNQLKKDALSVIYKDDIPLLTAALERSVLLKELDDHGVFTFTYRLNSPDGPLFVKMVAVYSDKKHIVISVTNIDSQIRREQKIREEASIAYEKARRDGLTGIKNKTAYGEFEAKLNKQIQSGENVKFAIALCDVNGLKTVNDTLGHIAGDEYIRSASRLVCQTFAHSPVFRIGGDEFVAILRGSDFENRERLEKKFTEAVKENVDQHKVVVACGISVFDKEHDKDVSSVFERADALMYKNKMRMKNEHDEIIGTIIQSIGAKVTN
ncbi:MAG: GGDEF domain-containing protein [Fibrobacter sp.]|jgi:diguanylate cyclase (GGDEF)-like protein|nr:GGDEF domain-containing protein [Fibrobacter sp.]